MKFLHTLVANKKICKIIIAAIAVMGGGAIVNYHRIIMESNYKSEIELLTLESADDLERWCFDGFTIDALSTMGKKNVELKHVVKKQISEYSGEAHSVLESLAKKVKAERAFVANMEGQIVEVYDEHDRMAPKLNISLRPYFKTAIHGGRSIYGDIDEITGERTFYVAAPIYVSENNIDDIVGVVVVLFDAKVIKGENQDANSFKLIVSPSGLVLTSNASPFLLKSKDVLDDGQIKDQESQFASLKFNFYFPDMLPFDAREKEVYFGGQRYAVFAAKFNWGDPDGLWTIITLSRLDSVVPIDREFLIYLISTALLYMFLWNVLRRKTDASRHKNDILRIEQSEQRLDMALQSGGLGLWDWNIKKGTIIINDVWLRILGYTRQELDRKLVLGVQGWTSLVHPEDLDKVTAKFVAHTSKSVDEHRVEYRMLSKDGYWLWVQDSGKIMDRDAQGNAIRVTGVIQDITSAVAIQQAILESQTRLESMIANIPGVVFRSLPNQRRNLIFVSKTIKEISGYSTEYFLSGHAYRDVVYAEDLDIFDQYLDGANYILEYRIVTASGEIRWVYDKGQMIKNDVVPQYVDGVIFDITERKAVEFQIQQSRRDAELAIAAKSDFLDSMSHEIRTPLNAVIGMAHILLETSTEGSQREYIRKIDHAANSLVGIVNSVLDLSKIEAGKLTVESIPLNLRELIDGVFSLLSQRANEKGLELRLDIPASLREDYLGDPYRITQVLTNLIANSIKFTISGYIKVGVRLVRHWNDSAILRFIVYDTGVGLSKEHQVRLFNAFAQADDSIARRYGGTGLGLTISKKLVNTMGGDIWVESKEGQGAAFSFTIQLKVGEHQEPLHQKACGIEVVKKTEVVESIRHSSSVPVVSNYIELVAGSRVLVVEDNELNQTLLLELLSRAKVDVVIASNGYEALECLAQSEFDAILMDCQMPLMDGYEASKEIRKLPHLKDLPIIAVTANTRLDLQGRILSAGMNDYIGKPIDISQLYRTLARWVATANSKKIEDSLVCECISKTQVLNNEIIDFTRGLTLVNQDLELYRRLLGIFIDNHTDIINQLSNAYARLDYSAVEFIAHTLQGSAANIGASALQAAAKDLEHASRKSVDLVRLIDDVEENIKLLLKHLLDFLPSTGSTSGEAEGTIDDGGQELEQLAEWLLHGNADALGLIDKLCERKKSAAFFAVRDTIYRMDFSFAYQMVLELKKVKSSC